MTDQTFLKPDQNKDQNVNQGTNDQNPAKGDEKDLVKILSKRVDDSQAHIKSVHEKLDAQNEIISKQAELLEKFMSGAINLQQFKEAQQTDSKETSPAVDPDKLIKELEARVEQKFQQKESEQAKLKLEAAKQQNFEQVSSELTRRYGDKVDEMVKQIASENDMSFQEAYEFAQTKPKAFLRLFPAPQASPQSSRPGFNSSGIQTNSKALPKLDPMNTKSMLDYYEALKEQLVKQG